jgi:hypothetical protein
MALADKLMLRLNVRYRPISEVIQLLHPPLAEEERVHLALYVVRAYSCAKAIAAL